MRGGWPFWLLALTVLAVAAVAFLSGEASNALKTPGVAVLSPLQLAVKSGVDGVTSMADTVLSLGAMAEENHRLKQQVDQLQQLIIKMREEARENEEYRTLVDFVRENPGKEYQPATVIGADPSKLVRSLIINRGTIDGVQRGMVVVSHLGLMGKITEVYQNTSRVLLVSDPTSVANGIVQRSRVEGVVTGRADQKLRMQYVTKSADVVVGDLVVTSGLGGGYPRGLLIGSVDQVQSNDQDLFKTIQIQPAFSPEGLRTVLLVKDFVPIELPRRSSGQ